MLFSINERVRKNIKCSFVVCSQVDTWRDMVLEARMYVQT